jgi:hypothetical protein
MGHGVFQNMQAFSHYNEMQDWFVCLFSLLFLTSGLEAWTFAREHQYVASFSFFKVRNGSRIGKLVPH